MASLIRPGLKFEAFPLPTEPRLSRTASLYGYGSALELAPRKNEVYIICRDGSVKSAYDASRPIGWELLEDGDRFYYRVTQVGFNPEPVSVTFVGQDAEYPNGDWYLGTCENSRDAIMIDFDDGEEEVTSSFSLPSPDVAKLASDAVAMLEDFRKCPRCTGLEM
jgi:hypothetical protein